MKIILIGSTGLVGSHVLKQLIADPAINEVVTPLRSGESIHKKHKVVVYNFDKNENFPEFKNADAIICTLGTTMKKAKSKAAFLKVDFEYPLNFAKQGKSNGVKHYILNTAFGANSKSRFFYNQVKGQIEEAIEVLNFEKFTIVRPGLIGGHRNEFRLAEALSLKIMTALDWMIPKAFKPNQPENISAAICRALHAKSSGKTILSARQIND